MVGKQKNILFFYILEGFMKALGKLTNLECLVFKNIE